MKALFIGGVKCGKSAAAERYILDAADGAVCYLATTELFDDEMRRRIATHRARRDPRFFTLEAPLDIADAVRTTDAPVLVECIGMWLNNMLYHGRGEAEIFAQIDAVCSRESAPVVFVHNDVGSGVIAADAASRRYVDLAGILAQRIALRCDAVYHCIAGIATRIK